MRAKQQEINATSLPVQVAPYFDLACIDGLAHISHGEYDKRRDNVFVASFVQLGSYIVLQLVTGAACASF